MSTHYGGALLSSLLCAHQSGNGSIVNRELCDGAFEQTCKRIEVSLDLTKYPVRIPWIACHAQICPLDPEWGSKPSSHDDLIARARNAIDAAPGSLPDCDSRLFIHDTGLGGHVCVSGRAHRWRV